MSMFDNMTSDEAGSVVKPQPQSPLLVNVKQEKIDPEVEERIKAVSLAIKKEQLSDEEDENTCSTKSTEANEEQDDKKLIEPVKTSNEILAELFQVFNAKPPEELLNNDCLMKKSRKSKKHKKEKKRKKHRKSKSKSNDFSNDEEIAELPEDGDKNKQKYKKKKKHKQKDDKKKDKQKCKSKTRENSKEREKIIVKPIIIKKELDESNNKPSSNALKRPVINEETREFSNAAKKPKISERNQATDKTKSKSSLGHNSFYNDHNKNDAHIPTTKIKTEALDSKRNREYEGYISDISLSDEEEYLKERTQIKNRNEQRSSREQIRPKVHNCFYDGSDRDNRDNRDNRHRRDHDRNRFNSNRERSRRSSRSRSRSRSLGIDKKRLLEIARKNAISMFKRGNLPGCDKMSEEIKDKVLLKMRYGGRTVQDLTDFCKKISNGENLSDISSDEESDVDKSGNAKAFHHPFLLKEREPIVMQIRNSKPILSRPADDQTKAITMQFPVSSGQLHRKTETWVPVEKKNQLIALPALPTAKQSTTIFKGTAAKNIFEKPMPQQEQQEPAFKPLDSTELAVTTTATTNTPVIVNMISIAPAPTPTLTPTQATKPVQTSLAPQPLPTVSEKPALTNFVAEVPVPSSLPANSSIFPPAPELDVSTIITLRLNAMRRLQENPRDPEAMRMMQNSQQDMSMWATSKHIPGQFTGSTGVDVLRVRDINNGPQAWARVDQLKLARPVSGGMGMHLLQKMGWKPGEGLGREKTGSLQPLLLDIKLDKRGLVAKEDNRNQQQFNQQMQLHKAKKDKTNSIAQAQQDIQTKHPVCILNELASKNKWIPPLYELVDVNGPCHSRMFLFKVSINGLTYTPNRAAATKKQAKAFAAVHCLQELGIVPKMPDTLPNSTNT